MRFFVALLPPPELVRDLAATVAAVTGTAGAGEGGPDRPRGLPGARWVDPARWHVTLAFLGPVDPATRPALDERLGRVARRHPPARLRVDGAGRFGDRVLWARVSGELGALATGVRRAAVRAGALHGDDRPLRAHLTLARVPAGAEVDLRGLVRALDEAIAPLPWSAEAITLMSSAGGPTPAYSVEGRWDLRGSPAAGR
ncbi:2'-5' RNA ligase [Frankia sp. EI5c]|uniref:RNA 2',3'-cyclic phosphodiesterase n=1 Tax=Frankia sp. EI5c TaxID=683316 RepID=UPI0007C3237D|nr:RNA 2',3'-cyclic phosphodiesterase [Frankia sp. EI5c]OAA20513.1 2'-5' RNA ligase [Frankia sp. EI5c]